MLGNLLDGIQVTAVKQGVYDVVSSIADTILGALPSSLWLAVFVVTALLPLAFLLLALRYLGKSVWRSALRVLFSVISGLVALKLFKTLPADIPILHIELGLWVALLSSAVVGFAVPLIGPKGAAQGQIQRLEPMGLGGQNDHPMV